MLLLKNFQPVKQVASTIVTPKYFKFKKQNQKRTQAELTEEQKMSQMNQLPSQYNLKESVAFQSSMLQVANQLHLATSGSKKEFATNQD